MRRWVAAATAGLVITALAGAALWFLMGSRTPPRLEAWTARVGVLAGDGRSAFRDGPTYASRFVEPFGIAAGADGSLIIADGGEPARIRRIGVDGVVTTIAGGAHDSGTYEPLATPSGVTLASDGTVYIADTGNNVIRRIGADGSLSTIAGSHHPGFADGTAGEARFNGPIGVAVTPAGDIVVADTYNDRIRAISPAGNVRTLAGSTTGYQDGPAASARFDTPCGIAVDSAGNVYVADTGNNLIRVVSPSGLVTTVTPLPDVPYFRPVALALDAAGTLYVADEGGRVFEVRPGVSARLLAGGGTGFADGAGTDARFRAPSGIAVLGDRRLAVTDRRNALLRIIEEQGQSLRPPASPAIDPQFDFEQFATTPLLWPVSPQDGPHEVTGTMGEMRGGEGGERFHAGLDIHAAEGTPVRAVRDGIVSDPIATNDFNTLNESVRIGPLVYVHQRVGRTRSAVFDDDRFAPVVDDAGKLSRMRVKRGARFDVGEVIGTTNAFNHVHLNVGWPREEINPLAARVVQLVDTVQPTIVARGIHVLDETGTELKKRVKGRLEVSGRVRVVVDAWDQVDGNRIDRRLGLYRLGYQVLRATGQPAPGFETLRETIRFDRLSPDPEAARVAYAPGSGIPFFGGTRRTRFLYEVTNELRGGVGRRGVWDTTALPPGDYTLRVLATDFNGNVAIGNRDLAVKIVGPSAGL